MNILYHVCNPGGQVLMRSTQDFIRADNKMAVASHHSGVSIIVMNILSNHFHILAEAESDEHLLEFTSALAQSYAYGYNSTYGYSISRKLKLSYRLLKSRQEILKVATYILKNPIHHNACSNVFEYRYGSGAYLFAKELSTCLTGGKIEQYFHRLGDLSIDSKRRISRSLEMPKEWLVSEDGMVMPFSFTDIDRARGIWKNNLKIYLYDMNKGIEKQEGDLERDDNEDLSWNWLNDLEVCKIIDDYATLHGYRSFHYLTDEDKFKLVGKLQRLNVPSRQICRCMWLTEDELKHYSHRPQ